MADGGVGAAVAVILALIFLKLRSRQKPAYMPPATTATSMKALTKAVTHNAKYGFSHRNT